MSVLVFVENHKGNFKKAALELVTFGAKTAQAIGGTCTALTIGNITNANELGKYGASKVLNVAGNNLDHFDSQVYTQIIADVAKQTGAQIIVVSNSLNGKTLLGRLAIRLDAGCVSGVTAIPEKTSEGLLVRKSVFSGKANVNYIIKSPLKVISLMGNSVPLEAAGSPVGVEAISVNIPTSKVTVKETNTVEGTVPLPEAELVVSGGRGFKGPENWGLLEDLANALGATTACSRPVADAHWRPHHEHVGQTGIAIHPNLYIAIGISGAIQHLAGVNNSKVIVVINKDPEAPFFKAADYGVAGDLFEVVPKLTAAIKQFKAAN
ncbi:MAG: electron transfer flavoprotein subunit alpha/FixB family protein [Saprospiraceae bacterium]|nr:electron transfer flavoprotein subunit alpha/FixB family protein [Saprospiraceae bacterium]